MESGISNIKETIKDFDKKPILNLIIDNVESDTRGVYEAIKEELGDLSLMIRPTFNMAGQEAINLDDFDNNRVGPEQVLIEKLKGYGNSKIDALAIDLYRLLSKDKLDESHELINQYYNDNYAHVNAGNDFIVEKVVKEKHFGNDEEDVQISFKKEVQE